MSSEHYHDIMKRYMFHPDGGPWPEPLEENMKRNFDMLYREIVLHWVDTEFKQAATENARVQAAAEALAVHSDAGGSTMDNVKALIRYFVLELTRPLRQGIVDAFVKELKSEQ